MIDERKLIAKLEDMAKESKEESGLKEPALLRKVMDEVKSMAVNEEIKARIEREDTEEPKLIDAARLKANLKVYFGLKINQGHRQLDTVDTNAELAELVDRQPAVSDRWIPVSERLPEETYVLVSFENSSLPDIGRYKTDEEGGAFHPSNIEGSYIGCGLIVNAWMPLPEPYKGE